MAPWLPGGGPLMDSGVDLVGLRPRPWPEEFRERRSPLCGGSRWGRKGLARRGPYGAPSPAKPGHLKRMSEDRVPGFPRYKENRVASADEA